MRIVLATHTREVKTSLFLALSALDDVTIVATATSTSELVSYCRALRPDVVVLQNGLPGRTLDEALDEIGDSMAEGRILIINGADADKSAESHPNVEKFSGIDMLIDAAP